MVFRIAPRLPVTAVRTWSMTRPPGVVGRRPATCAEVDCAAWREGWTTRIPMTDQGRELLDMVRRMKGHTFVDITAPAAAEWTLVFGPGQACFAANTHRVVASDWEPLYGVCDGDWRGNPTGYAAIEPRAGIWVERFGEHQQKLADAQAAG
jgi:hypothetical protein